MLFSKFVWILKEIFFPRRCIFCGEVIEEEKDILVCGKCEKSVPLEAGRRSFDVVGGNINYLLSPFEYKDRVRDAVIAFKFYSKDYYAESLAFFMNETLCEIYEFEKFDFIIPVPMGEKKLKKRGYNQAELLANKLKFYDAKLNCDALIRIKEADKAQSLKSAVERAESIKGCFACIEDMSDKSILLVDDVCTTGVTLNECANELKKAGAKRIVGITSAKRNIK